MDEVLPNALVMGVSYDLFWELDPDGLRPFTKAFSIKQKQEDVSSWRLGLYVRMAIASCLTKKAEYPKRPMLEDKVKEETPEERQKLIKQRFMNHAMLLNTKFMGEK